MVLLKQTKKKSNHKHLTRSIILGIITLCTVITVLILSCTFHSSEDIACKCLDCILNKISDGDYLYNRYLPIVTVFWIIIIFLPIYLFKHKKQK